MRAEHARWGMEDAVVAFGGYNGACQNETQILRVARRFPRARSPGER